MTYEFTQAGFSNLEIAERCLAMGKSDRERTGQYPPLWWCRDVPGNHTGGPNCWCKPALLTEEHCWLDWSAEELAAYFDREARH